MSRGGGASRGLFHTQSRRKAHRRRQRSEGRTDEERRCALMGDVDGRWEAGGFWSLEADGCVSVKKKKRTKMMASVERSEVN